MRGVLECVEMGCAGPPFRPLLMCRTAASHHALPAPPPHTHTPRSKDRYRNQTQLLEAARGYITRGLPISMIVLDWFHWVQLGASAWGWARGGRGHVCVRGDGR